jgi:hypothetical protein
MGGSTPSNDTRYESRRGSAAPLPALPLGRGRVRAGVKFEQCDACIAEGLWNNTNQKSASG